MSIDADDAPPPFDEGDGPEEVFQEEEPPLYDEDTTIAIEEEDRMRALDREFRDIEDRIVADVSGLSDVLAVLQEHIEAVTKLIEKDQDLGSAEDFMLRQGIPICVDALLDDIPPTAAPDVNKTFIAALKLILEVLKGWTRSDSLVHVELLELLHILFVGGTHGFYGTHGISAEYDEMREVFKQEGDKNIYGWMWSGDFRTSVFLVININTFAQWGGFDTIVALLKTREGLDTELLTMLVKPLADVKDNLVPLYATELLNSVRTHALNALLRLSEECLSGAIGSRGTLNRTVNLIGTLTVAKNDSSVAMQINAFYLKLEVKMCSMTSSTMRARGVASIVKQVNKAKKVDQPHDDIKEKLFTYDEGHMSSKHLATFLKNVRVVDILLDSGDVGIMVKSIPIFTLLTSHHMFDQTDVLVKRAFTDDTLRAVSADILLKVAPLLSLSDIDAAWKLVQQPTDQASIDLVCDLTMVGWRVYKDERAFVAVTKKRTIEPREYGLSMFMSMLKSSDTAVNLRYPIKDALSKLLSSTLCVNVDQYVKLCMDSLLQSGELPHVDALHLLRAYILTTDDKNEWLNTRNQEHSLVKMCLETIPACDGPIDELVYDVVKTLEVILSNSTIIISSDEFELVWSYTVTGAKATDETRELLFDWLKKTNRSTTYTVLNDESSLRLLLCVADRSSSLTHVGMSLFERYFLHLNKDAQQYVGVGALWNIVFDASEEIGQHAIDLLSSTYLVNVKTDFSMPSWGDEQSFTSSKDIPNICLAVIDVCSREVSNAQAEWGRRISRCLTVIQSLNEVEIVVEVPKEEPAIDQSLFTMLDIVEHNDEPVPGTVKLTVHVQHGPDVDVVVTMDKDTVGMIRAAVKKEVARRLGLQGDTFAIHLYAKFEGDRRKVMIEGEKVIASKMGLCNEECDVSAVVDVEQEQKQWWKRKKRGDEKRRDFTVPSSDILYNTLAAQFTSMGLQAPSAPKKEVRDDAWGDYRALVRCIDGGIDIDPSALYSLLQAAEKLTYDDDGDEWTAICVKIWALLGMTRVETSVAKSLCGDTDWASFFGYEPCSFSAPNTPFLTHLYAIATVHKLVDSDAREARDWSVWFAHKGGAHTLMKMLVHLSLNVSSGSPLQDIHDTVYTLILATLARLFDTVDDLFSIVCRSSSAFANEFLTALFRVSEHAIDALPLATSLITTHSVFRQEIMSLQPPYSLGKILRDGLLSEDESIRITYANTILGLVKGCHDLCDPVYSALLKLFPLALTNYAPRSSAFLALIAHCVLITTDASATQSLLNDCISHLKTHTPIETTLNSAQSSDPVLIGLLRIANHILRKFTEVKHSGMAECLCTLLFASEVSVGGARGGVGPPICKSQPSRALSMQVLVLLAGRSAKNAALIVRALAATINNASIPMNRWSIDVMQRGLRKHGYVGLVNQGCTCYMNSVLQQLFMVPEFRHGLLRIRLGDDDLVEGEDRMAREDSLLYQVQALFATLSESRDAYAQTLPFCRSYKDFDGRPINVREQQDANEFLNILFDRLETGAGDDPRKATFRRVFGGTMMHEVKGTGIVCKHVSQREEPFFTLGVDVIGHESLESSLDAFISASTLDGDNQYRCDKCDKRVDARMSECLHVLPPLLIINLKRFAFDPEAMRMRKVNDRMSFPMSLNMKRWTYDDETNKPDNYYGYDLTGVLIHSGSSNSGHYYSYIADGKDWYEFNDKSVTPINPANLPHLAFGGPAHSKQSGMNRGFTSMFPSTHHVTSTDKHYSAYMLVYRRKLKADVRIHDDGDAEERIKSDVGQRGLASARFLARMMLAARKEDKEEEEEEEEEEELDLQVQYEPIPVDDPSLITGPPAPCVAQVIRTIRHANSESVRIQLVTTPLFRRIVWRLMHALNDNDALPHVFRLGVHYVCQCLIHTTTHPDVIVGWFTALHALLDTESDAARKAATVFVDDVLGSDEWIWGLLIECPIVQVRDEVQSLLVKAVKLTGADDRVVTRLMPLVDTSTCIKATEGLVHVAGVLQQLDPQLLVRHKLFEVVVNFCLTVSPPLPLEKAEVVEQDASPWDASYNPYAATQQSASIRPLPSVRVSWRDWESVLNMLSVVLEAGIGVDMALLISEDTLTSLVSDVAKEIMPARNRLLRAIASYSTDSFYTMIDVFVRGIDVSDCRRRSDFKLWFVAIGSAVLGIVGDEEGEVECVGVAMEKILGMMDLHTHEGGSYVRYMFSALSSVSAECGPMYDWMMDNRVVVEGVLGKAGLRLK